MSAESEAFAFLSTQAPLIAIVADRFFADFKPQEHALPALVIELVESKPITTIHSNAPCGYDARLEFVALADSRARSIALGDAIATSLETSDFLPVERRNELRTFGEAGDQFSVWATVIAVDLLQLT
jgi:hypothetical protein